jgi:hypothetical protein
LQSERRPVNSRLFHFRELTGLGLATSTTAMQFVTL